MINTLCARQVHLDFHTSELIQGIGDNFSQDNFQEALRIGHVNSITVFAKCHHSWCYYPSHEGKMHPHLKFDMTGAMVDAAHEIGVRAPVYITVGWSANDAESHPEWTVRNRDGTIRMSAGSADALPEEKRPIVSWKFMCPGSGYEERVYAHTAEVCTQLRNLDGLFFDICFGPECWCEACVKGMASVGLNPDSDKDAKAYNEMKWERFAERCTDILKRHHPDATLFFNGGADIYSPRWLKYQTHFEMEDLPTTWGGYDKMPLRAKYLARKGKPFLGMTGKFHTMWGEFGGFKNKDALRYECAAMATYGARCSVGDQMHPSGEMDMETYRIIGEAYRYMEALEPWCYETDETANLGLMLSGDPKADEGIVRMLLETQKDFDIVDPAGDLGRFEAIILSDVVRLDSSSADRINHYIGNGGGVLLTGAGGLEESGTRFLIDTGSTYLRKSASDCDYARLLPPLDGNVLKSPFLMYESAHQVRLEDGEVLSEVYEPYFNRTYGQYCSHQNTPNRLDAAVYPGAVRKGGVVYLAHEIGRLYYEHGAKVHRDYFMSLLNLIYHNPVVSVHMPSSGRVRLARQTGQSRYVLHLLYATPIQRGRTSIIEDLPTLYGLKVSLRVREKIIRVASVPDGEPIVFTQEDGRVEFAVPHLNCHRAIVLDYGI